MGLSAAAWIAIGAACAAAVALGVAVYLFIQVRRLRANQVVLLGGGKDDLVDFAVSLQARMDDLHGAVSDVAAALSRVDRRVDGSVTNTSLVRYDAYEGAGGHQSGVDRAPRRKPNRDRPHSDPGPRLRAHLCQRAGARPAKCRPVAGRATSGRKSNGGLTI